MTVCYAAKLIYHKAFPPSPLQMCLPVTLLICVYFFLSFFGADIHLLFISRNKRINLDYDIKRLELYKCFFVCLQCAMCLRFSTFELNFSKAIASYVISLPFIAVHRYSL